MLGSHTEGAAVTPRYAAKVDDNQRQIVEALRDVGASVQSLAAVGKGVPDLLVGFRGETYILEVKDGRKVPSARHLRDSQKNWHATWMGRPVHVVESLEEALMAIGIILKTG